MKTSLRAIAAAGLLCLPCHANAQVAALSSTPKEPVEIPVVKIVLHPMGEPRPALRYRLLPPFLDLKPGNAAVLYNKIPAARGLFWNDDEKINKICELAEAPLDKLRGDEASRLLASYEPIIEETIRAAHYEYCDWQIPIREREYYLIPLNELQQSRGFARLLGLKSRIQMAEGKYVEAVRTLQAGYALARHVNTGPLIVQGLVGLAVADMMSDQVREFVQQPDAPNLYWSLSALPSPLVDLRLALQVEAQGLYLIFPELRDLDKKELSPESWRELLVASLQKLSKYAGTPWGNAEAESRVAALLLMEYPRAKNFLIERGMSDDNVEAMPVSQVALLYCTRLYDEFSNDCLKWSSFGYAESKNMLRKYDRRLLELRHQGGIFPFFEITIPAFQAAFFAQARCERNAAMLRVCEALRLYAAAHGGRLPEKLGDITEVPVPLDPVRGKPFAYQVSGDTARLESLYPEEKPQEHQSLRYEIQMLPKGNEKK
ncbi:MAG: hypothetical protein IT426_18860 [Pirellulales bacterium]|nr:hypothetical protein [Pirellulales bacterium]